MTTVDKLLMTVAATTVWIAASASAAVNQPQVQPFDNQSVQARGYPTVDRHECRSLKARNLQQPKYCIYR